ncbi:hypothetical protein chiPu_0013451 [Chiloscyllium punctatum]|uniref:Uncharacterized protein n=1 Tax=Chiloscyllium punctatum TaxID=137246 RepID=A0A401SX56_CHIPU|nr:hypothetical protein [Chiloscyllium punctatum]
MVSVMDYDEVNSDRSLLAKDRDSLSLSLSAQTAAEQETEQNLPCWSAEGVCFFSKVYSAAARFLRPTFNKLCISVLETDSPN